MRVLTIGSLLEMCLFSAAFAQAKEIVPGAEQTTVLQGAAEAKDGIRAVTGKTDATGHGPITYCHVPFQDGTFSLMQRGITV